MLGGYEDYTLVDLVVGFSIFQVLAVFVFGFSTFIKATVHMSLAGWHRHRDSLPAGTSSLTKLASNYTHY